MYKLNYKRKCTSWIIKENVQANYKRKCTWNEIPDFAGLVSRKHRCFARSAFFSICRRRGFIKDFSNHVSSLLFLSNALSWTIVFISKVKTEASDRSEKPKRWTNDSDCSEIKKTLKFFFINNSNKLKKDPFILNEWFLEQTF